MNNGNGTFTITYTDGSSFISADLTGPMGPEKNLATDNLIQDAEARTYNMNGQNLAFTNGQMGVGTAIPTSTLHVGGSFAAAIRSTNTSTALTAADFTLIMYNQGLIITLPVASDCPGRIYVLKNLSLGDNNTSLPFLTDNGSSATRLRNNRIYWIQSDGTNWQQIVKD